ncbi:hypothetical protein N9192_00580 [Akkermansiaceae bacterium]|nr:hypothetical protein [Akkermansiaceae bacterium]
MDKVIQHDSVNQWIDAGELRSLAESLMNPVTPTASAGPDEVYGDCFVGYADFGSASPRNPSSQSQARDAAMRSLSAARGAAASAGIVSPAPINSSPRVEYTGPDTPLALKTPEPASESVSIETVSTRAAEEIAATYLHPQARPANTPIESPYKLSPEAQSKALELAQPHVVQRRTVERDSPETPVVTKVTRPYVQGDQIPVQSVPSQVNQGEVVPPQSQFQPEPPVHLTQTEGLLNQEGLQGIPQSSSPSGQPLARRMQSFGSWLKQSIPAEAFFVCDRNGEIISDEVGNPKFVKVARTLAHAASSAGRQVGDAGGLTSPHVKIGSDRILQVIPKRSKFGLVVLGVIVPEPLGSIAVSVIAHSLSKTLGDEVLVP